MISPQFFTIVNNKGNKLGELLCNGKGLVLKGFKLKGNDKKGMMYQQKYISVISDLKYPSFWEI